MHYWIISSQAAVVFGVYPGETPEAAFDAMVDHVGGGTDADGNPTQGTAEDWHITPVMKAGLVVCRSADGWSLHAPGSTDEEIASGDLPYLACGEGEPTEADYAAALRKFYD